MIVLAADTSTDFYSVAVVSEDGVLGEVSIRGGRRHSERLLETTSGLMREMRLDREDIGLLAVSHGPGSFTGLRVGVSAWKGLALGWSLPLAGVGTLDAMARLVACSECTACPVLDAKMDEVFWAAYAPGISVAEPSVSSVERMLEGAPDDALFFGDGSTRYRDAIVAARPDARFADSIHDFPRASAVGAVALTRYAAGEPCDAALVEPVYLRGAQAEETRKPAAAAAVSS